MGDSKRIVDHNCAAKVLAALLSDGGVIVTEKEAIDGTKDQNDSNFYLCIDMGDSGVICIRRPKTGTPPRIAM